MSSLSEALSEGLQVTITGLVIVFAVLIILMIVMMLMKVIFYNPGQKKAKAEKAEPMPKEEKPQTVAAEQKLELTDDSELIAVLTAAVAACMDTPAYKLNIKSYRRIENNSTAWNRAGVRDIIDARF